MKYEFRNCKNGEKAVYKTELEITEKDGIITFTFDASNSEYYCCDPGYNKIHTMGDACEILIGTDPKRGVYYEIEVSPIGDLMIAQMINSGVDENGKPILKINFVEEPFVTEKTVKKENGYVTSLTFPLDKIRSGDGEIYFNAYRIETDGGEPEKHLFSLNPTMQPRFHVPSKFLWLKDYI